MNQAMEKFRMDEDIKKDMKKISEDRFYSESNMKYLEFVVANIETGRANLVEHELFEN